MSPACAGIIASEGAGACMRQPGLQA